MCEAKVEKNAEIPEQSQSRRLAMAGEESLVKCCGPS
jgi:hypothetical protein